MVGRAWYLLLDERVGTQFTGAAELLLRESGWPFLCSQQTHQIDSSKHIKEVG
jgi:hypothetical protein